MTESRKREKDKSPMRAEEREERISLSPPMRMRERGNEPQ